MLQNKQEAHQFIKESLRKALECMKLYADKKRVERSFQVGDYVYLKLKPYRQRTLHSKQVWKLSPKYTGPFQILSKVGTVAYRLDLPPTAKVHPVFYVLVFKRKVGPVTAVSTSLPEFDDDGKVILHTVKVLARRLVRQGDSPPPSF